jgi:release factor glutamine methyltransferase
MGYAFFISTQNMKHEIQDNTPYCPTILGEQTQQAEGIKTNTPHLTPQLKRILMSHITGLSTAKLLAEPNLQLTKNQQKWFDNAIERLQNNEPLQHILGYTTFYGRQFKCDRRALIPRPETEELIDWIINDWTTINNQQPTVNKQQTLNSQLFLPCFRGTDARSKCRKQARLHYALQGGRRQSQSVRRTEGLNSQLSTLNCLDIGTGTGCIALSLAKELKDSEVTAVDISTQALTLAHENAELLGSKNITFVQGDILNHSTLLIPHSSFHIIVSNPPYVRECEKADMEPNVLDYDPHTALFVSDTDPLIFYRAIGEFALTHLKPNGALYFEINQYLATETCDLLIALGYKNVELRKDINDNPRMIKAII